MHQSVVLDRNGYNHILESVFMFPFHGEDTAEMLVVVLPEDPVLCGFQAVKNGLHSNGRKAMGLKSICPMVKINHIVRGYNGD